MTAAHNLNQTAPIHFLSLNVKGLNSWVKRQKIDNYLKQLKVDVGFLQETHLKNEHVNHLKRGWVGHVFHSRFNAKARGTAIVIHKDIPFMGILHGSSFYLSIIETTSCVFPLFGSL